MHLEYCRHGDLYDLMRNYTDYQTNRGALIKGMLVDDLDLLRSMFRQLASAVASLHNDAGYAHMDIKLENILISNQGQLKLCDFGFSTYTDSSISKILGT
mmetsp:Transcript_14140/g.22044  ORF Transcript_14140/g.22044 Transcript_14140/m.22044 type:complete len:100 (-) Transcript_14140:495-794(-)